MGDAKPSTILTGLRIALGLSFWLTPRLAARLIGINPRRNPQLPYVSRLFAVRDIALGAGLLLSEGQPRSQWLQIGIACDAVDAVAGVAAGSRGQLNPLPAAFVTSVALAAGGLGYAALHGEDDSPPAT